MGTAFATTYSTAAARVSASVRFIGSLRRRHNSLSQRGQRADAPGASSGRRCSRSQSGQAMSDASASASLNPSLAIAATMRLERLDNFYVRTCIVRQ